MIAQEENENFARRRIDVCACVKQVIEVEFTRGTGVDIDPVRWVKQYRAFDGTLLAEADPYLRRIASAALNASSDSM